MLSGVSKIQYEVEAIQMKSKSFIFPENIYSSDILSHQRYFICHRNLYEAHYLTVLNDENYLTVGHGQVHWIENHLLDSHQLIIGYIKIISDVLHVEIDSSDILTQFRQYLLTYWLNWSRQLLNNIWDHFKNRDNHVHQFTTNTAIQIAIADVLTQQHIVESSIRESSLCLPNLQIHHYKNALYALSAASVLLARLYGGRAFLADGVVEMMALLEYFRKIYF
ncbi:MAG: hypothetical protein SFW66_02945 [Gammaproteobacteria bacterium]|nr:hypothetical protein [Gammaproteobacteria bacterium]